MNNINDDVVKGVQLQLEKEIRQIEELAQFYWVHFEAFMKQGFSREESLELIIAMIEKA